MTKQDTELPKKATGLLIIEVRNSNPNGDPDRDSDPRQRHDDRGEISPVSFKRKIRDLVEVKGGPVWEDISKKFDPPLLPDNFEILESRGRDRQAVSKEVKEGAFEGKYWDGRIFGNTFLEKEASTSIKTGVVHFGLGLSISPIVIERMTLTNKSGVQEGKDRGMAPLGYRIVQHGVYSMPFFVNPTAAVKTGCSSRDIELLLKLIPYAYTHTASHGRPMVEIRHAWYMEHLSRLGSCSDFDLIDALTPRNKENPDKASTSWEDYEVPIDLPERFKNRLASFRDLVAEI